LGTYVQQLAETVCNFQKKVEDLSFVGEGLNIYVRSLEMCQYSANTFGNILGKIQHTVEDLNLRQYSTGLDEEVNETYAPETLLSHTTFIIPTKASIKVVFYVHGICVCCMCPCL
jgi:hypothetical protein